MPKKVLALMGLALWLIERGLDFSGWENIYVTYALWALATILLAVAFAMWIRDWQRKPKIVSTDTNKDCPALILEYEGNPRGGTEVPFIIRNDGPGTALKVLIRKVTDQTQDGGSRTLDFGQPISQIPEGGKCEINPEVWTEYWDASKGPSRSSARDRLSKYLREKMRVTVTVTYQTSTGKDCRRSFDLIHDLRTGGVRNEPIFDTEFMGR